MRIPPRREPPRNESELHARAVQGDRVVLADLYQMLGEKIIGFVKKDLKCDQDTADNAVFDVFTAYVQRPGNYDPRRAPLVTYLTRAAKYRAMTRLRSGLSTARREEEFGRAVELWRRTPKEEMENAVEAKRMMEQLRERGILKGRDLAALELILSGERSTERLAEALGLGPLPPLELRREVKRHRDRLMKMLERVGKEDSHDRA